MTVFATAAASIAADPNMGVDAIWSPADGGPPETVRVIVSAPDDAVDLAEARVVGSDVLLYVTVAALATPGERDAFEIDGTLYAVQAALLDATGDTWRLPCRKQGPATLGSTLLGNDI